MTKKIMRARRTPKVIRKDSPTAARARKVTRPKTAYDLLERVIDHIREEPKRYYQDSWRLREGDFVGVGVSPPMCNTAACRGGWIVLLHDGLKAEPASWCERANEILGLARNQTTGVFGEVIDLSVGSSEYVRQGIRGLRQFMKKHAAHLKARKLADVPKLGKG